MKTANFPLFFSSFFFSVVSCNKARKTADSIFASLFVPHSVRWNYACNLLVTPISCLRHERKPPSGALPLSIEP